MNVMSTVPEMGATLESFRSFLIACLYGGPWLAQEPTNVTNLQPQVCQCFRQQRTRQRIMHLCATYEQPNPQSLEADLCALTPVLHGIVNACTGRKTFGATELIRIHNATFKLLPGWFAPILPWFFVTHQRTRRKPDPARLQLHANFLPLFGLLSALRELGVHLPRGEYQGDENWSWWRTDRKNLFKFPEKVISWCFKRANEGFLRNSTTNDSRAIYPMSFQNKLKPVRRCDQLRSAVLHISIASSICCQVQVADVCTRHASAQLHFAEGIRLLRIGVTQERCLGALGFFSPAPILDPLYVLERKLYNHIVFFTNLLLDHSSPNAVDSCVILVAGASTGETSSGLLQALSDGPCAQIRHRVYLHAFEPHPWAFRTCTSFLARDWASKFKIYPAALSDKDGKADLFLPDDGENIGYSGVASLHSVRALQKVVGDMWSAGSKLRTPVLSASSWRRTYSVTRLDLLWLDMEGHELTALRGLQDAGLLDSVTVIRCEVSMHELLWEGGFMLSDLTAFLDPLGFDLVFVDRTPGLYQSDAIFRRAWRNR